MWRQDSVWSSLQYSFANDLWRMVNGVVVLYIVLSSLHVHSKLFTRHDHPIHSLVAEAPTQSGCSSIIFKHSLYDDAASWGNLGFSNSSTDASKVEINKLVLMSFVAQTFRRDVK